MKNLFYIFLITGLVNAKSLIINTSFHTGWSQPIGDISDYIEGGLIYHSNVFVGQKVNSKTVDAVGMRFDFSFANYALNNSSTGHYRRYTTDLFFLPVGNDFYTFNPGFNWVLTDIYSPELGLNQLSIRPSLVVDFEIHLPIHKQMSLNLKYRYEYTIQDEEYSHTLNQNINIQGQFQSFMGGFLIRF